MILYSSKQTEKCIVTEIRLVAAEVYDRMVKEGWVSKDHKEFWKMIDPSLTGLWH